MKGDTKKTTLEKSSHIKPVTRRTGRKPRVHYVKFEKKKNEERNVKMEGKKVFILSLFDDVIRKGFR